MKNKKVSRVLTALLAAVCVVSMANGALAAQTLALDSGVTLSEVNGRAQFAINGGAQNDLFLDFKDVMPGDVLSQTINVSAAPTNGQPYRIYLYARECVNAETPEGDTHAKQISTPGFLDELTIRVSRKAAAGETADTSIGTVDIGEGTGTQGVLLGTFTPGTSMELNVDLVVELTMGNEFANAAAYIDWVFYADTIEGGGGDSGDGGGDGTDPTPPTPPTEDITDPDVPLDEMNIPDPEVPLEEPPTEEEIEDEGVPLEGMPPQTGDTNAMFLWLGLAVVSGGAMAALIVTGRKSKQTV